MESLILHVPPQDVTLYYDGEVMPVNSEHGMTLEIPGFHGDLNETYPVGRIDEDSGAHATEGSHACREKSLDWAELSHLLSEPLSFGED